MNTSSEILVAQQHVASSVAKAIFRRRAATPEPSRSDDPTVAVGFSPCHYPQCGESLLNPERIGALSSGLQSPRCYPVSHPSVASTLKGLQHLPTAGSIAVTPCNPFRVDEYADGFPSVAPRRRNAGLSDGILSGFQEGQPKDVGNDKGFNPRNARREDIRRVATIDEISTDSSGVATRRDRSCCVGPWVETHGYLREVATRLRGGLAKVVRTVMCVPLMMFRRRKSAGCVR